MKTTKTFNLFYIYSHKDQEYLEKLETYLKPVVRHYGISSFYDKDVPAGCVWEKVIDMFLAKADTIFILTSPDSIASDYCGFEIDYALKKHEEDTATVIPVYLRHIHKKIWELPNLKKLKELQGTPSNGEAITQAKDLDEAFGDVASSFLTIMQEKIEGNRQIVFPLKRIRRAKAQKSLTISQHTPIVQGVELGANN